MSDTGGEIMSHTNSKANLIEVQHVGVTAKLQSPLKKLINNSSSSTEAEAHNLFNRSFVNTTKYDVFHTDTPQITETTDESSSRVLYEMRSVPEKQKLIKKIPTRIEFQRYNKHRRAIIPPQKRKSKTKQKKKFPKKSSISFCKRLSNALDNMCQCKPESNTKLLDDLPEPNWNKNNKYGDGYIGIYPFEHGCAEYLSISDNHPKINSIIFAERATVYATHFWAELFGLLHIGVAFLVAFILQTYRFILYSLINTLAAGLLHMTSDYLIKPILTATFNGFIQPPMIFIYNVLCSMRDISEPISDAINNMVKPLATVLKSFRLIHANCSNRKVFAKEV